MVRVAINGFGRVGRCAMRAAFAKKSDVEIVAINDITDEKTNSHLFKYDSIHGRFNGTVESHQGAMVVNGKEIRILTEKEPKKLPWKDMKVDIVLECTGKFVKREEMAYHMEAGAKKVILSAPAKGEIDGTFCIGINHNQYDGKKHNLISNASCTTNCLAPVAKVLQENFGIINGMMTTIHSYTLDQRILDSPHKDLRRARAGAMSMIPTTTGAAKAIGLVLPELKGKLDGFAMRVPTPNVSVVDLVVNLNKSTTKEQINEALRKAANGELKGVLAAIDEELVSMDFLGDTHSSLADLGSTMMMGDKLAKVVAWYDNEMGYSTRLWDLCSHVAKNL